MCGGVRVCGESVGVGVCFIDVYPVDNCVLLNFEIVPWQDS